jgi:hypothetical protein
VTLSTAAHAFAQGMRWMASMLRFARAMALFQKRSTFALPT